MYNVNDTIAALSSPASPDAVRNIIRLSGPQAFELTEKLFKDPKTLFPQRVFLRNIQIDNELRIDALIYAFQSPHSYTGDNLVEFHITAPPVIVEAVLNKLFSSGARAAGPGEFTSRAYLNGKMDLAQAEAVAHIICSSNSMQLAAAQKLLEGRLSDSINETQKNLIELISRIEAGLDFAGEDIQFISNAEAITNIENLIANLHQLVEGSIACEETISLPSVGIVGAPNAGKSSLLNALLGMQRSIISDSPATTRDVLTGLLKLPRTACAIFDCAGLLPQTAEKSVLETLAQNAATKAIQNSELILFCVDISKSSWADDQAIFELILNKNVLFVATKCDKLEKNEQNGNPTEQINAFFAQKFFASSSHTRQGLDLLINEIDKILTHPANQPADFLALNLRHRICLDQAAKNLDSAKREIMSDNDELAAMFLRNAYNAFSDLSFQKDLDDAILERIFSTFCIGK